MIRRAGLALVVVLAACRTAAPAPAPTPAPEAPPPAAPAPPTLRLPGGVKPTRYALSLRVVPGEPKFEGEVTVALQLERPLEVLWLNARELTPGHAEFTVGGARVPATAEAVGEHFLLVRPAAPLPAGPATLSLRYQGLLSVKNSSGLFSVKEGADLYAVTHFEPLDARRAFPCFDEPAFKVPWQLTLHVKQAHQAFHNTPIEREVEEPGGMKAVHFAQTRPLPSYLLAFAVGPFETVDAGTWGQRQVPLRIVTPRGKAREARSAAASSGPLLEELERYFGTPYPYEKLDLLALPMGAGAMEHPGLVTWGYRWILVKPESDTPAHQRAYATVCAHELAHMWFGDLVTMAWWDDLWLNEAFATWLENKIVDAWRPAWGLPVDRVTTRGFALSSDALATARRVREPIVSEDDIANAFDAITYEKGASVISMFEAWVGPEAFQRGVRAYLATYAWGNATAAQFLAEISRAAGVDVAAPFSSFLDQSGAPRVAMELSCPPGEAPRLLLQQRRQLPVGSRASPEATWQVPVRVRYSAGGREALASTLLTQATGELRLEAARCPDWVMPNEAMQGYYRASLTGATDLLRLLRVAGGRLSVAERVGLLDDVEAAVNAGDVPVATSLAAIPLALQGDDRHLLEVALRLAGQVGGDVLSPPLRPKYAAFLRATFGPRARQLGLTVSPNEDEERRLSRPWLLRTVAIAGEEPALRAQGLALARAWLADRKAVHPDLVSTVLGIAASTGDRALHAALLAAVKTEPDRADRSRLFNALSEFRDPALVQGHLGLLLEDAVDAREAMALLWGAAFDYRTSPAALAFVQANWDALVARLPADSAGGLVWLGGGACDASTRDAVRGFFAGRSTRYLGGQREFEQTLEGIDLCIAWRARHRESAERFIDAFRPAGAPPRR